MPTKISIYNQALYKLGKGRATNPSQEAVFEDIYATQRDLVLRAHPWNFAQEFYTVTNDASKGSWKYAYTYTLPTDPYCLRVLELEDPKARFFVGSNRKLHTDIGAPLNFLGIARMTSESLFTADFADALATKLAFEAGPKLASIEKSRRIELWEEYKEKIGVGRSIDGQEGNFLEMEAGSYEEARY